MKVLERIGLKGEEIVYFDDSKDNIKLAKEVGIRAFVFEDIEKVKKIIDLKK